MTPTCVNLRERFGQQYRISHDEAALTWGERADPWMMTIPCRWGIIYPHGAEVLALELDGHPKIAKQIAEISGIVLHQDGDDEKTFVFPVGLFEQVARGRSEVPVQGWFWREFRRAPSSSDSRR